MNNFGPPQITRPHNHESDELVVEVLRLKQELRRRCAEENTSMIRIFGDIELEYSREAIQHVGGREAMRSSMYRSRQRGTPNIPQNLREYAATLGEDRWRARYATELGPGHEAFFRRLIVAEDQSAAVIFTSPTILHYVNRGVQVDLLMDATFKVVPRKGAGTQLFAIHIHYDGTVYPILYVLMERKTYAAYHAVLSALRQLAPQINARSVMTDYEVALREAVRAVFPEAQLLGCWFHFARAVFKRAASIGLVRRNDVNDTRRFVKMAMVLPLLPENLVAQGIQELRVMAEDRADLVPFFGYLEARWLPVNISVYRQPQRTNNAVESFHRDLLRVMAREHPNIWSFTENLQRIEHSKAVDFLHSLNAVRLPRRPRIRYHRLNVDIRNAQNVLDERGDVTWFLRRMSHAMRNVLDVFQGGLAHNDNADDIPRLPPQLPHADPPAIPEPLPQPVPPAIQPDPLQQPVPLLQQITQLQEPPPLILLPRHYHPNPNPRRYHPYPNSRPRQNSPPPLHYFK